MSEHAPGPWSVDFASEDQQWTDSISIADANGGHVAHLTRGYEGDASGDGCPSWANARLIAAAPDLLAALREIHTADLASLAELEALGLRDVRSPENLRLVELARAAIAKATAP